ncbi:MAG: cysteine desulfurase family protein [bacterium]
MKYIYLDNSATTRLDPQVFKAMQSFLEKEAGNASSLHKLGVISAKGIERAREVIAKRLNAEPHELLFTSGGTESNNLALKGVVSANKGRGKHVIISKIEHPSVHNICAWLERQGLDISYLPVNKDGLIAVDEFKQAIRSDTLLVSIMHVNNEIGTLQPISEIGMICRAKGIYFHTDACQSFAKTYLDVKAQELDLVTINAHKLHGPQGVGALWLRKGVKIEPLLHGGGQELNLRSGTYNVAGIVGFGKAVELAEEDSVARMQSLRDYMITEIETRIPNAILNGSRHKRVCNNLNFSFAAVSGKALLLALDKYGIIVSSGSACSARSLKPSRVLLEIGLKKHEAHSAIRFSLSKWTTKEEIDFTVQTLIDSVKDLRGNHESSG